MRKLIPLLISICIFLPIRAQEIWVPEAYSPPSAIQRTSLQKGVDVSTDVAAVAMPVAALVGSAVAGDWEGMKQFAFTAVVAGGTNLLLKTMVRELRPDHSNYHSFPSMHSTVAFGSAAFIQRRYGWKFGAPAYAVAAYVAVGRVVAKKHHWWDCLAGAAIGAGSAYLFTTPWSKKHKFAMSPFGTDESIGILAQFSF